MENKSPTQIAIAIGAPTRNLLGTQDWNPPLHPGVTVSMLHYSDNTPVVCFRVTNNGVMTSKLPDEPGDSTLVDSAYGDTVSLEQYKNLTIIPSIITAVPDLDPSSPNIVRGLSVGGVEMIADLVNGQIKNLRIPAVMPSFSIASDGSLSVDTSKMKPQDAAAVNAAIHGKPQSPSIRSSLLR